MYPCKQCQYISISAIVCIRTNNFAHRCSLTVGAGKFCRFGNFFWWANFPRRPWNPKMGELRREGEANFFFFGSQSVSRAALFLPKVDNQPPVAKVALSSDKFMANKQLKDGHWNSCHCSSA